MNIKFIPIISPNDNSTTIVETLTLQEVFEKYGHLLSDREKLNLVREIQKSWIKDEDYLKRMTEEVDKLIKEMLEEEIKNTLDSNKIKPVKK